MAAETLPAARRGPRDLTSGPIAPALVAFALPTLGSNILQSMNASINTIWIGRFLGHGALAATANANLVLFIAFAVVFGFGLAATILIGQAVGARDLDRARRVLGTAIGGFAVASVAVSAAGWFASDAILRGLATPGDAMPLAHAYLRVIFLSLPASFLVLVLAMALRGAGDAVTPFAMMIVTVVLDAGLNPVLILGLGPAPRLGIAGSALATVVASYATLIGFVAIVYGRRLPIRLIGTELRYLVPDPAILRVVMAKGLPMGAQMFVVTASALALTGIVNRAGVDHAAAFGVAQQLWSYVQMPALAVGAAVSAMAAQNIGAGRWERVGAITRSGIVVNVAMTSVLIVALTAADRPALSLFLPGGGAATAIAAHANWIVGWSFVPFGVTMVLFATVRANGAVTAPLVILAIALIPVRLGVAFAGAPRFGIDAVWWALPIGSIVSVAMAAAYYRFGGWRRQRMMPPPAPAELAGEAVAAAPPTTRRPPVEPASVEG
ncbi:MATE family efflux transporter [Sphingomonas sp.]|uniref:MATE family efflux transporter n=1 Tax=Sphingomonas sp. TaxID=28214 RepID=UPI003B00EC18